MHTPSRIIPMYPEEGALHEIGDAGGGRPASGNIGTAVGAENDHGQSVSALTRFSYSRRALR